MSGDVEYVMLNSYMLNENYFYNKPVLAYA